VISETTEQEREWLQRPFEEQEVLDVIKLYATNKAPGHMVST